MIDRARAIREAGIDIFTREVGEIGKQFIDADWRGERVEHVADAHTRARDDRPAAAHFGIDDDARTHRDNMRRGRAAVKVTPPPMPPAQR